MVYDSIGKHPSGVGYKGQTNDVGGNHMILYVNGNPIFPTYVK
jgi:hypothetical protein